MFAFCNEYVILLQDTMCDNMQSRTLRLAEYNPTIAKEKYHLDLDLTLESERLQTFNNWKNNQVTPQSLAKAGFYSKYENDTVTCAFCNVEIGNWEEGDDPMVDHRKWSPQCRFVAREISAEIGRQLMSLRGRDQDVCGSTTEYFPNSFPENEKCKLLFKSMIKSFEDFKSRLETFTDWPKSLKQKPIILAEAGFYYEGTGDKTVCFECNGGLKDWEEEDDPWEQHALWFPTCKFLVDTKGQDFISDVKEKFKKKSHKETKTTKEESSESGLTGTSGGSGNKGSKSDSIECKICFDNIAEVVFLPCGHFMSCLQCAMSLKNICPYCRKRYDAATRIYPA